MCYSIDQWLNSQFLRILTYVQPVGAVAAAQASHSVLAAAEVPVALDHVLLATTHNYIRGIEKTIVV